MSVCKNCGGPLQTETYAEGTITFGDCGYSRAGHFGGGEIQEERCRRPVGSWLASATGDSGAVQDPAPVSLSVQEGQGE